MNLKINDLVKIKKDSKYYNDGMFNPPNTIGRIVNIQNREYRFTVHWNNIIENYYRDYDLIKITKLEELFHEI